MYNMDNNLYKIKGEIENIVFRNNSNGYSVIEILCDQSILTCTGIMPNVSVGDSVTLYGKFVDHPQYGEQFEVENYEKSIPETIEGILKYLSNGSIKGIGPASANKLVKEFGNNTLEVLENEPERVAKLKGFSKEKAESISMQLKNSKSFAELIEYLKPFHVQIEYISSIFKMYASNSIEVIKDNPYILCEENIGVPFDIADEIANSIETPKDARYRVCSAISYVIKYNKQNGHTCLPENKLIEVSASLLELPLEVVESNLKSMLEDNSIYREDINEKSFIFSKDMYEAEKFIASSLGVSSQYRPYEILDVDYEIERIEKEDNIKYADLQKQAIYNAVKKGLLILTGGPGTGKTTTLNAIIKILEINGQNVELAAPTGRAAQRMSELTHKEAKTIHRMLEATIDKNFKTRFKKNEHNLLDCDALIVDEASMIDVELFCSLIKALPLGCRLIIVGDSDQLPSVGPGNILGDLIASETIPYVKLTEIFRQALDSLIVTNAHKIVNGTLPDLDKKNSDFVFISANNNKEILDNVISLYTKRLPEKFNIDPISDIQIISPTKKTPLGTYELNKCIQQIVNPKTKFTQTINVRFATLQTNDKVMQIKNDYDVQWVNTKTGERGEGVFNGDIGILKDVDHIQNTVEVEFDDKLAIYVGEQVQNLELAYACTVHKSQGNEFDIVIMPVFNSAPQLMYRNLLYTAVTRAKKLLVLVGYEKVIEKMVNNNSKQGRYTGLKDFMQD